MCSREIRYYEKLTGEKVRYCDVSATANPAADLSREDALARFHVRLPDGSLVVGAAAFLALWRATPGFGFVGLLLSSKPMVAVLDVAYSGFLQVRRLWR